MKDRWFKFEKFEEDVWFKRVLPNNGFEFIEIVWLDTCPYDPNKEYCICSAEIDSFEDIFAAYDYFQDNCITDSSCIKGECSYQEALEFIQNYIKEN